MESLVGAIIGGVGGLTTPLFGWLKSRSDNKHEENMGEIAIREKQAEADAAVKVAAEATRGKAVEGEWKSFEASYKNESTTMDAPEGAGTVIHAMYAFINFVRAMVRPTIIGVCLYLFVDQWANLDDTARINLISIPLLWPFGERGGQKLMQAMNGGSAPKWVPKQGNVFGFPEPPKPPAKAKK